MEIEVNNASLQCSTVAATVEPIRVFLQSDDVQEAVSISISTPSTDSDADDTLSAPEKAKKSFFERIVLKCVSSKFVSRMDFYVMRLVTLTLMHIPVVLIAYYYASFLQDLIFDAPLFWLIIGFYLFYALGVIFYFLSSFGDPGKLPRFQEDLSQIIYGRLREGKGSNNDDDVCKRRAAATSEMKASSIAIDMKGHRRYRVEYLYNDTTADILYGKYIFLDDNKKSPFLKYCTTCKLFRPPSAHHCSFCDRCIGKYI